MILAIIVWTKSTHKISFIQSYINESIKLWWIWLCVPIYIILKSVLQSIIQRRLFLCWFVLQSFVNFKLFQCRNKRFLRLGIIIIIIVIIIRDFYHLHWTSDDTHLLMFILLHQLSVSVKGNQIMSSSNLSRRGFIQFGCAHSRSTHSSHYYLFGGTIKLWVSSLAPVLWNVFLYMTSSFCGFKESEHFCIPDQKKNSPLWFPWCHIFSKHTFGMKILRPYFNIIHAWF